MGKLRRSWRSYRQESRFAARFRLFILTGDYFMSAQLRALVIDDSGIMRKMVMKGLTDSKLATFEFVEAVDGKDALDKLNAGEFHIAFVDWNMPNMTGVEFVKEVRTQEKQKDNDPMPMVMVTSEKTMGKLMEALDEAGADGFISKPFTVEELQHKLKKHVDRAQVNQVRKARKQRQLAGAESKPSGGFFGNLFG